MAGKTWFLPPDFTSPRDGQIALGDIILDPLDPTATLASLHDYPGIRLPSTTTIVEKNRSFAEDKSLSFGMATLMNFSSIPGLQANIQTIRHKNQSFSAVDHEVVTYNRPFSQETLEAIVSLDSVRRYMKRSRPFGARVYIISGLRIALQSFTVTEEEGRKMDSSFSISGPPTIELGASISGSREHTKTISYETAPEIVFAYRLHVIKYLFMRKIPYYRPVLKACAPTFKEDEDEDQDLDYGWDESEEEDDDENQHLDYGLDEYEDQDQDYECEVESFNLDTLQTHEFDIGIPSAYEKRQLDGQADTFVVPLYRITGPGSQNLF